MDSTKGETMESCQLLTEDLQINDKLEEFLSNKKWCNTTKYY